MKSNYPFAFLVAFFLVQGSPAYLQNICVDPYGTNLRIIGSEDADEEVVFGHTTLPDGGYMLAGSDGDRALLSRYDSGDELVWHRSLDISTGPD